jgi:AraC-like DNA-binding protein
MEQYRKYYNSANAGIEEITEPNWGISVHTIGHYLHPSRKKYPDVKHPDSYYFNWEKGRILSEFQLLYIANGKGIFESENTAPIIVEAGTAFLLFPGVWHRYKPLEETGWEEFWVGFKGHYAEYLMQQDCFMPQKPMIKIGFNSEFLNVFIRLIDTLKYEGVAYRQLSSCLVIQLLGLVYTSALMSEKSHNRQEQIIHHIRYKIHENWESEINFEELASQFNVSYVWFRKAFKAVMGISPGQYHLNIKIEKACQIIRETTLSISEIAYKTGFYSEFYFSKIFKKKMNVSPSDYRKAVKTS